MTTAKVKSIGIIPQEGMLSRMAKIVIVFTDNNIGDLKDDEPAITFQMTESEAWHLSEELAEALSKKTKDS